MDAELLMRVTNEISVLMEAGKLNDATTEALRRLLGDEAIIAEVYRVHQSDPTARERLGVSDEESLITAAECVAAAHTYWWGRRE